MSKFLGTLKQSIGIFTAHPKLILPKLIVALLYGALILLSIGTALSTFSEPSQELLNSALLQLVISVVAIIIDIIVSAMYPFMVKDILAKKQPSIFRALAQVFSNAKKILLPIFLVEFVAIAVFSILISLLVLVFLGGFLENADTLSDFDFFTQGAIVPIALLVLLLLLVGGVVFLFYTLIPVVAYEKTTLLEGYRRAIQISLKNKSDAAKATLLSIALSFFSFAIAFAIEYFPQTEGTILFWAAFLMLRFLTAYVYSYLYILSPLFYLNYAAKK